MLLQVYRQSAPRTSETNHCHGAITVYSSKQMIRILATIFAGLLGLAFGSFLNVFVTRWPQEESVVKPRSHCRHCDHALAWWENIPLLSWIFLGGRCRQCKTWIGWRYPLVELAIGSLWAYIIWIALSGASSPGENPTPLPLLVVSIVGQMLFYWIVVALAALDFEFLWLPDVITLPGAALGFIVSILVAILARRSQIDAPAPLDLAWHRVLAIAIAAGVILLIRWTYWLFRRREGIGLGDAKLMAMLAAWMGLPLALLAFAMSAFLGAAAAFALLAVPAVRRGEVDWATSKLPFGTFICIGGIISSLWGPSILAAYLRLAGL